jgi:hypothetical protein
MNQASPVTSLVIAAFVLAALLWAVFKSIPYLYKKDSPRQIGAVLHYRMNPIIRAFVAVFTLAGIIVLGFSARNFQHGLLTGGILFGCLGLFALALGLRFLGLEIVLDVEGVHCHRTFFAEQVISWDDLSHVERSHYPRSGCRYYIRSNTGKTIVLDDWHLNADHILRQIRLNRPLREQPYRRKQYSG